MVSIQSSHTPFKVQMFLTRWKPYVMFPFNSLTLLLGCPSCGNVIYGISCLYSLSCLFCGDVIYGTIIVCLIAYITISTTITTIGTSNGSILPLIIFYAFKYVLSYSLFIPKPEAPPSSTLFFILRELCGKFVAIFFMFSYVVYISFVVLLTLAGGFYGLSF